MNIQNKFPRDSQNHRLLQALLYGPITTGQLLYDLKFGSHRDRVYECRKYLKTVGFTITKKSLGNGCYEYRIARLQEKVSWWSWVKSLIRKEQEA